MFKKLISVVLIGVMALSLAGFNWFGGGSNKTSNYSDADFKDYFYCYVDGSGILHFTSNESKGEFTCVKFENYSCHWGDKNRNIIDPECGETYNYVAVKNGWFYDIEEITIDDKILINFSELFSGKPKLKKINNIENIVTTTLDFMFHDCESLETLDLSRMDVSHVKSMNRTFEYCKNLKSLNISNWNTSKVEEMWGTFSGCRNLTTLDIENWDVSNVKNMREMFDGCEKLAAIPSWYDENKK